MADFNFSDREEMVEIQEEKDFSPDADIVEAIDTAVEQEEMEDETTSKYGKNTLVTSTGYVLRAKDIGFSLLERVMKQIEEPSPPVVTITEAGKTWEEENKSDPAYIKSLEDYTVRSAMLIANTCALLGVDIIEYPENAVSFDDDKEWIEQFDAIGISIPTTRSGRYLEWLKLRVIPSTNDINDVQIVVLNAMGVTEEDIEEQMSSFQD